MNLRLPLVAIGALLSSCVSTEYRDYEGSAYRAAQGKMCERHGLLSADDFAHYANFQLFDHPRQFGAVDEQKMRATYFSRLEQFMQQDKERANYSEAGKEAIRLTCAQITVVASRVRGNARPQPPAAPVYTPATTTNCLTTGTWTRCTTN